VTVQPPAGYLSPPVGRFIIGITNVTKNPFAGTSAPLSITLDTRPDFTVTVRIDGPGHVSSDPSGINCGTICRYSFGNAPNTVTLHAGTGGQGRFLGWSGNCSDRGPCNLNLDGSPASVVAHFGPLDQPISSCPAAPMMPGWTWRDRPTCTRQGIAVNVSCDSQGFFCCEPGVPESPRCLGPDKRLTPADCFINTDRGTRLRLFPGGCYEVNSP
jgi:hypothetical protein